MIPSTLTHDGGGDVDGPDDDDGGDVEHSISGTKVFFSPPHFLSFMSTSIPSWIHLDPFHLFSSFRPPLFALYWPHMVPLFRPT